MCYSVMMRASMNISLPPALRDWVEQQVEARGFGTASEFVRDMIRRERERTQLDRVDQKLLSALKTPVSKLTDNTWKSIRREGKKRVSKRKKK